MYKQFSMTDLMQIDKFKQAAKFNNTKVMEEVLWELGLDTSQPYVFNECLHRALTTNIPVQGVRIEGYARSDKEWLNDKYVPVEDIAYGMKDKSFGRELNSLNPHSYVMNEDERGCSGIDLSNVGEDCV